MNNETEILEKIIISFPAEPLPTNFFSDNVMNYTRDIEESLVNVVYGKKWTDVSLLNWTCVADSQTLMGVLSPSAFHYYLPSLLIGVIGDSNYFSWGVGALLPNNKFHERKGAWWHEYESLFNAEQKNAVGIFLDYVFNQSDDFNEGKYLAQQALLLWRQA